MIGLVVTVGILLVLVRLFPRAAALAVLILLEAVIAAGVVLGLWVIHAGR